MAVISGSEAEGLAQRPIGDTLHGPAPHRGQANGDDEHEKQGERDRGDADGGEGQKRDQGDERTDHENIAMGEINHADDAVDHRVSDGDQAVDRAERHAIDELLQEISHACLLRLPPFGYAD